MTPSLLVFSLVAAASGDDVFTRFDGWAAQYRAAKGDYAQAELLATGIVLAGQRRSVMLELMQRDPEAALGHAVSRDGMPESVANQLELPVQGIGAWHVLGRLANDRTTGIERYFVLGSARYRVTAYKELVRLKSRERLWADGFALDGWAALHSHHVNKIGGNVQGSAWTTGTKKLRFIRVDFSDAAGDPLSLTDATNLMSALNQYLQGASYGKTQLNATVVPTTQRMPRTRAAYGSANDTDGLLQDARSKATQAGYPTSSYDLDVIAFRSVNGWDWAGLGFIGMSGTWLNGSFSLGTVAHEVGHNLGLYHANFWQAGGETIIGAGSSLEYGNPFEIMGDGDGHYNAWYKFDLDWFGPNEVAIAAANTTQTYRVYNLEQIAGGLTHAIRVPIGFSRDYWVEFRPGGGGSLARGASINWGYNQSDSSNLLDMQPWTSTANDSALVVGRTFSDFTSGIHITPTAVVTTTQPTSLDVTVSRGLNATNHAPTVTLACAAQGSSYDCTATAMDQDGDTLAYYWDFGDGVASTNSPMQSRNVVGAKDVNARVTVSDMKGGTATASVATKFGNPGTYRITGVVTENGQSVEGVRVYSGTKMTWTSTDGTYTLVGLSSGSNQVSAIKPGWTFVASFTNPVNVNNANVPNINFSGSRATFTISGRVTSTGTGFAGATVSAGNYATVTNSNGDYTLTGVPAGAYQLTATGPNGENFITQGFTNPVQITTASTSGKNFIELVFPLSGKVTGLAGPHLISDGVRAANTALNGGQWTWTLPKVPPGTWNIMASASGQAIAATSFVNPVTVSLSGAVTDATGAAKTALDFDATAGTVYFVTGFVSEAGGPSLGTKVDAGEGVGFGATDSRGIYVVPNLPAGTHTLMPAKSGYVFGPPTLDVTLPNPDGGLNVYDADFLVLNANAPPTFAFRPHATPSPVPGSTCNLVTLGHDPIEPESDLKYTWTQTFGAVASTFSLNGTNAAKSTTVTFTRPGAYAFDVKVEDPGLLSSTASVTLLVLQTTTSVAVMPATATVDVGSFKQFVATVKDQFGEVIDFGGEATWSVAPPSCGTITQTGKLTVMAAGACTVTAEYDGKMGTAAVTAVVGAAPRVTAGPTANPSPVTSGTTTALSVTAEDDEGEAQLTYTWSMVNGPVGVAFAPNGSNAAKASVATFTAAGTYDLQVVVKDSRDISTSAFVTVSVSSGGLARVTVTGPGTVGVGGTAPFVAAGSDLANAPIATGACTWSASAGSIDGNGVLTASEVGMVTVTATCGGVMGSANITVTPKDEMPMGGGGCHCGATEGVLAVAALLVLARRRRQR